MRLAEHFRVQALKCLKLADGAPSTDIRAYWTSMAQVWHNLATHLEERNPSEDSGYAPEPWIAPSRYPRVSTTTPDEGRT